MIFFSNNSEEIDDQTENDPKILMKIRLNRLDPDFFSLLNICNCQSTRNMFTSNGILDFDKVIAKVYTEVDTSSNSDIDTKSCS